MHQNIAYSFEVGNTIERFKTCTPEEQANIEEHIVKVILESFVEPADDDYLAARTLAIGGMHRSFFWSAAQAVEKYLKAYLLLRGVSVVDFSHKLNKLLNKAEEVEAGFADLNLGPHPNIAFAPGFSLIRFRLREFTSVLERYGSASNRYNNHGAIYDTGHLLALDALAFYLRNKMQVPNIESSFHRVLGNDFRRYLFEANPYFAPVDFTHTPLPSNQFSISFSASVPHWEFLQRSDTMQYLFAKQWLAAHMQLDWPPRNKK
ncbi:hypothetical protein B0920_05300 [Massilia sp. KIM]|uniref:HEPN domain-containing protein n=1 Tax=Massilia sp. KIM TaxID=1955422 RepID=UPI00098F26EF|nr:HEPN domain-containing protein [Massilia sp. KIM]OON62851.1 hypothetical protein B0920_05300 [Massilia sp. KIM]